MGIDVTCKPQELQLTRRRYFKEPARFVDEVRAQEEAVGFGSQPGDVVLAAKMDDRWEAPSLKPEHQGGLYATTQRQTGLDLAEIHSLDDLKAAAARIVEDPEQDPIAGSLALGKLLKDTKYTRTLDTAQIRPDVDHRDLQRLVLASSKEVQALARKAAAPGAGGRELMDFLQGVKRHDGVMRWVLGQDKEASRLFRDSFVPPDARKGGKRMLHTNRALTAAGGHARVASMAAAVARTLDHSQVIGAVKQAREQLAPEPTFAESVRRAPRAAFEVWTNSALSSPDTHSTNIISNAFMLAADIPIEFISRTLAGDFAGAFVETYYRSVGIAKSFGDARRLMVAYWRTRMGPSVKGDAIRAQLADRNMLWMLDDFTNLSKVDDFNTVQSAGMPRFIMEKAEGTAGQPFAGALHQVVARGVNLPVHSMMAMDVAFKTLNARSEMYAQAARAASQKGLKGAEWRADFAASIANPSVSVMDAAAKKAHLLTFTEEMGPGSKAFYDMVRTVPGLRYLAPFIKTPSNIVEQTMRTIPGGFVLTHRGRQAMKGAVGREARRREVAQQAFGGLLIWTGMELHERGVITGPGGFQFGDERIPPWSIRVGEGEYLDYRRLAGPLGVVLGMGALWSAAANAAESDEEIDYAASMFQAFSGGLAGIMNETSLTGVLDVLSSMTDEDGFDIRSLDRTLIRTADNFVPYQAFTNYMRERLNDGVRMDPAMARGGMYGSDESMKEWASEVLDTLGERVKGRMFWLNDDRWPKRNLYGEPLNRHDAEDPDDPTTTFGQTVKAWLVPRAYLRAKKDPLSQSIQRLGLDLRMPRRSLVQSVRGVSEAIEYTPEQYDYIARRAGEMFKERGDRIVAGADRLNDPQLAHLLRSARSKALKAARMEALREFPELQARRRDSLTRVINRYRETPE